MEYQGISRSPDRRLAAVRVVVIEPAQVERIERTGMLGETLRGFVNEAIRRELERRAAAQENRLDVRGMIG